MPNKLAISAVILTMAIPTLSAVCLADEVPLPMVIRYDFDDKPGMLAAYIAQAALNSKGHHFDIYTVSSPEQLAVDSYSGEAIQSMSSQRFHLWGQKYKVHHIGFNEHVGWWIPKYMSYLCDIQTQEVTAECLIDLSHFPISTRVYADIAGRHNTDIGDPCISQNNSHLRVFYATRAAIHAQARNSIDLRQAILIETRSLGNIAIQEDGMWVRFRNEDHEFCSYKRDYFFVFPNEFPQELIDIVKRINITHDEMIGILKRYEYMNPSKVAKEWIER